MTTHIMLDLETLSTSTKPAITEIAAVAFDLNGNVLDEFWTGVKMQSSINLGLDVSASTLEFWLSQPEEARESFMKAQQEGTDIVNALLKLNKWALGLKATDIRVWGNGIMADNRWLESAIESAGLEPIFKHWQHSDVRTIVDLGKYLGLQDYKREMKFEGVKHNPVDDCKHQIKYLCAYMADLKAKGEK